jgi:hypothetical protein
VTLASVNPQDSSSFPSSYPNLNPGGIYRSRPQSEISSHDTAPFAPSDSGYATRCGAPSVMSVSQIGSEPDYSDLPLSGVGKMVVTDEVLQESDDIKEPILNSQKESKFQQSPQRRMQVEKCKYCGATPKCPSDLKYV